MVILSEIDNYIKDIHIIENVLSDEEYKKLLDYTENIDSWEIQPWKVKYFTSKKMTEEIVDILDKIFRIAYKKCTDFYNVKLRVFNKNEVTLIRFDKEYAMNAHADTTGDFAVIYYINDDYDGGEINFPEFNLKIKPNANSFILFPSNENYVHEVLKNIGKERYSSTLWFNFEGSPYRGNINEEYLRLNKPLPNWNKNN